MRLTSDAPGQALLTKRKALIEYHRHANYLVFTKRTVVGKTGFDETVAKERNFDQVLGNSRLLQSSSNFDKTNGIPVQDDGVSKGEH